MKPRKPETITRAVIAGFLVAICGPVEFVGATPALDEQLAAARQAGDRLAELEVLENMAAARPGDDSLLAALARGWLVAGDAASAARALTRMKSPPVELRALVEARRMASDQPEAARRILEEAVAANPGSIELWEALVDLLAGMGEPGQAVALLARAPAARDNASLGLREARARRAAGDYRGAIEVFRSLPAADAEIQRAAPEFERLEAAMPALESTAQRLARNPSSLEDRVERANALRAAGLDKPAGEEGRTALESHPSSRAALVLAANLPRPEQFHHPGIKLAAENLAGGSATAENLRRLAALDLEVERGGAAARAERARLLVAMRQPLLALEDAGAKDSVDEALARLEALAALGRAREASALAARIESQDRKSAAQAWTLAAEALLQSWEIERAEAAASRAIERGGSQRAHELRAAARQRLGDEEGARADLAAASKAVR